MVIAEYRKFSERRVLQRVIKMQTKINKSKNKDVLLYDMKVLFLDLGAFISFAGFIYLIEHLMFIPALFNIISLLCFMMVLLLL